MALFKKKEEKKDEKVVKGNTKESTSQNAHYKEDLSWVIKSPRISEKSLILTDKKVYVFEVDPRANKSQIRKAVKQIYGVDPIKINTSIMPRKKVMSWKTNTIGKTKKVKKAYVYLNKKDSISFV